MDLVCCSGDVETPYAGYYFAEDFVNPANQPISHRRSTPLRMPRGGLHGLFR